MTRPFLIVVFLAVAIAGLALNRLARRRRMKQIVAVVTCLALVLTSVAYVRQNPPSRASDATATSIATARIAAFDNSLRAIEDGDRESPRDRWDPRYVAQTVGTDPQKIYAWIRDHTSWVPYRGVLRGPVGVLMDRQGNSLDRGLLLVALLESAGHRARLAHRTLTPSQAIAAFKGRLPRVAKAAAPAAFAPGDSASDVAQTADTYHLDAAPIEQMLDAADTAGKAITMQLVATTDAQATALVARMPRLGSGATEWQQRFEAALDAARDHWWAQWADGSTWINADPAELVSSNDGDAVETFAPHDLPDALYHKLIIRLNAEYSDAGQVSNRRVFEHAFRAADIGEEPATLQLWPGSWPSQLSADVGSRFGVRATALEQDDWGAILQLGQEAMETGVISRRAGHDNAAAGNPFAGIASSFQRSMAPSSSSSELSAVSIDYEVDVPGRPAHFDRRYVFDLLGAGRRASNATLPPLTEAQRVARCLSLMMRTEILAVSADISAEFVTHRAAQAIIGNAAILRAVLREDWSPAAETAREQLAQGLPPLSPLVTLAMARLAWSPSRRDVFIDSPNVLTRHAWPVLEGEQVILRDAVDIVANGIAVRLRAPDAVAVRIRQGVFDTNLEAVLASSATPSHNTGLAYAQPERWATLTNWEGIGALALPADSRQQIVMDVSAGYTVVAPQVPIATAGGTFAGWWRVDPQTGTTLGMNEWGWGSSLVERGRLSALAATMIRSWAFEYGLCMGVPQMVNAAVILNEAVLETVFGSRYVKPYDPGKLAGGMNSGCLVQGLIAGAFSTLPLLLMTLRSAERGAGIMGDLRVLRHEGTGSVDPLARTEPGLSPTKISPRRLSGPRIDPEAPPIRGDIKVPRTSNDTALFGSRHAKAQAEFDIADAKAEKLWGPWWEAKRQAFEAGVPGPLVTDEMLELDREVYLKLEELEELEAEAEGVTRDAALAERNAAKAGVRNGDTQRSGRPPQPATPPAPAPCAGDCGTTVPGMKTITGIGGAAVSMGPGG